MKRPLIGIEITQNSIKIAHVEKSGKTWNTINVVNIPILPGILKLSYQTLNIQDGNGFFNTIKQGINQLGVSASIAGLSLPNEIIKTSVEIFDELPSSKTKIQEMIQWWAEKTFRVPRQDMKIGWHVLGQTSKGRKRLFLSMGFEKVIKQYETLFRKFLKIDTPVVRSSALNQFNAYAPQISSDGDAAYIAAFETCFCFMVIQKGQIVFFHKSKNIDSHMARTLDMTIMHYKTLFEDHPLETIYLPKSASPEMAEVVQSITDKKPVILNIFNLMSGQEDYNPYASAIGAAQSLTM